MKNSLYEWFGPLAVTSSRGSEAETTELLLTLLEHLPVPRPADRVSGPARRSLAAAAPVGGGVADQASNNGTAALESSARARKQHRGLDRATYA